MAMISQELLKKLMEYNSETGELFSLTSSKRWKAGRKMGTLDSRGYISMMIDGYRDTAHRLAWIYVHGDIPENKQIDHVNGNRADNRLVNLRIVTRGENQQNRRNPSKRNSTGYLGVSKHNEKYRAKIFVNKKTLHLGLFETAELAYQSYLEAKRKYHSTCSI